MLRAQEEHTLIGSKAIQACRGLTRFTNVNPSVRKPMSGDKKAPPPPMTSMEKIQPEGQSAEKHKYEMMAENRQDKEKLQQKNKNTAREEGGDFC